MPTCGSCEVEVSNGGVKVFGSGFTSTRTGTGVYDITFTTPFFDQPSITATCNSTSTDRIAIIQLAPGGFVHGPGRQRIGNPVDNYFDIIAIGRLP